MSKKPASNEQAESQTEPALFDNVETEKPAKKASANKAAKKAARKSAKKASKKSSKEDMQDAKRVRVNKAYPTDTFAGTIDLGISVFKFAGDKIRRLTLCKKLNRSPTSSTIQTLITNSSKYGITIGSYAAEFIELTEDGAICCNMNSPAANKRAAEFRLAIQRVQIFNYLYERCVGKRLPDSDVLHDWIEESGIEVPTPDEAIDIFIVNIRDLELLQTIAGAETVVPIDAVIEELGGEVESVHDESVTIRVINKDFAKPGVTKSSDSNISTDWDKTCFYITPIGDEGSDARKHSDMFMHSLIEPAMEELGLKVVRSDKIGEPGMINSMVIEHIRLSKLCIADLSMLNPNVFYEMGLRNACNLPLVQLIRKSDKLPFDVGQVKSIAIDLSDWYLMIPKIPTYVTEIRQVARKAIEDPSRVGNPIAVFYPKYWDNWTVNIKP